MKFVDLFAGLGGFHLALKELQHECVYACEIDKGLQDLYEANFGMRPAGDISKIQLCDIPPHDVLCAGFPCQSFSKAGSQRGLTDLRGGLLKHVVDIIRSHEPRYVILENVAHFERHANGKTYRDLKSNLESIGYQVDAQRFSPHHFGIPQIRDRLFIVASRVGLEHFQWPDHHIQPNGPTTILDILDSSPEDARPLSEHVIACLNAWQSFLEHYPEDAKLPSFPIWSMEFGATYPYEDRSPLTYCDEEIRQYSGSHGRPLADLDYDSILRALPSHARRLGTEFPRWKVNFIRQNRELYDASRNWIDRWTPSITGFPSSFQKFEWNCQGEERNLWNLIIQFRASGVRVKRPTTAPSLVAMTATQVPIIGWERRYMTPRECARLQSMEVLECLPASETKAFEALGNAVNVKVVALITEALLNETARPEDSRRSDPIQRRMDFVTTGDARL